MIEALGKPYGNTAIHMTDSLIHDAIHMFVRHQLTQSIAQELTRLISANLHIFQQLRE